jgi:hypothetical protein
VIAALSLVTENLSPSIQLTSTTVAGFDTNRFYRVQGRLGSGFPPIRESRADSGQDCR